MSVTAESRPSFVVEPDAKLRITATKLDAYRVSCTVELRRGAETLTVTIAGSELLRLAHNAVWCENPNVRGDERDVVRWAHAGGCPGIGQYDPETCPMCPL